MQDSLSNRYTNITYVDSLGNVEWSRNYYLQGINNGMEPQDIFVTGANDCMVLTSGSIFGMLFKIDSIGNVVWSEILKDKDGVYINYANRINGGDSSSVIITCNMELLQVDYNGWTCDYMPYQVNDSLTTVTIDSITLTNTTLQPNIAFPYLGASTQISVLPIKPLIIESDSCLHVVGLETSSETNTSITVFPNPGATEINISSAQKFDELCITDMAGRAVKNISVVAPFSSMQISVSNFPSGVYLITLSNNKTQIGREKFVVYKY